MMDFRSSRVMRRVLGVDAAACGLTGLLLALDADLLRPWLGLETALMRGAGWTLVLYAAFVAWLAMRPGVSRGVLWLLVGINVLWTIDSLALLAAGWASPTTLGTAFVIAQALVAGVFAELYALGSRRGGTVPA